MGHVLFVFVFFLTARAKFSVFPLSKMNNASSFAAVKRTTCTFLNETSNFSGLKAVKPTTFTSLNPNLNPDQLAHFSS